MGERILRGSNFKKFLIRYHFSTSRALWAEQIPPRGAVFARQPRCHVPVVAAFRPETLRPILSSGLLFSGLGKRFFCACLFAYGKLQRGCHLLLTIGKTQKVIFLLSLAFPFSSFLDFPSHSSIFREPPPGPLKSKRLGQNEHFCFAHNENVFIISWFKLPKLSEDNQLDSRIFENSSMAKGGPTKNIFQHIGFI